MNKDAHRYFSVACNQQVWQLLAGNGDADEIIHLAHPSLWHWTQRPDCTKVHLQRVEYLIALAYVNAKQQEPALYHAQKCKDMTEANAESKDFEFAYAFLMMAMATGEQQYLNEAKRLCEQIKGEADKRIFFEDVQTYLNNS